MNGASVEIVEILGSNSVNIRGGEWDYSEDPMKSPSQTNNANRQCLNIGYLRNRKVSEMKDYTTFDDPTPRYGYVDLNDNDPQEARPRWWRNEPYVTPWQGLVIAVILKVPALNN